MANLVYIERIGGGGFGEVWKARDRGVDALRAVKIVEPSAIPSLKDFNDEARVLNELAHDNIITVYGAEPGPTTGTTPDVDMYVIIMEYMDDGSLDDALQKEAFLPLREAVHRFSAACFAAAHAHGKGYIHRDIKPANILVSDARTKLSDFGLCVPGAVGGASGAGTLVYAAPEVADGNPTTVATDIYSVSYTHLDVYKRQHSNRSTVFWRVRDIGFGEPSSRQSRGKTVAIATCRTSRCATVLGGTTGSKRLAGRRVPRSGSSSSIHSQRG